MIWPNKRESSIEIRLSIIRDRRQQDKINKIYRKTEFARVLKSLFLFPLLSCPKRFRMPFFQPSSASPSPQRKGLSNITLETMTKHSFRSSSQWQERMIQWVVVLWAKKSYYLINGALMFSWFHFVQKLTYFFIFVKASPDGANQVGWLGLIRWAVFKRTKYRPTFNMEVPGMETTL